LDANFDERWRVIYNGVGLQKPFVYIYIYIYTYTPYPLPHHRSSVVFIGHLKCALKSPPGISPGDGSELFFACPIEPVRTIRRRPGQLFLGEAAFGRNARNQRTPPIVTTTPDRFLDFRPRPVLFNSPSPTPSSRARDDGAVVSTYFGRPSLLRVHDRSTIF